ncbi:methyltransferase domain-containing protein [soil metagenome]
MPQQQTSNPAQTYEEFFGPALFKPWTHVLLDRASPQPGERVLDVACGTGIVTRSIPQLVGPTGRVVGVDISPDMLAVARSVAKPPGAAIEWLEGNASELDLPDESFDLVLCQQGLQFFPDRAAAARGMHRVLVDGGRAVLAVWQALDRHAVLQAMFTAEARHLQLPVSELSTPFSLADETELRTLLRDAGFRDIEIEPRSLEVAFPSDRYIELTVRGGAAVIPALAKDESAFAELVKSVEREAGDVVRQYRRGDALVFPMHAHIAVAHR